MQVKDSVFVVSGGASGLGEQVVRSLVAQGGYVMILDVQSNLSKALVTELGERVYYPGPVDVTSEKEVVDALDKTAKHFKSAPLIGAVLCSGILLPLSELKGYGPDALLTSYQQFEHVIRVNLLGTYNVAQKVAARLLKNEPLNEDGERGIIITTSSITGLDGVLVGYGTSKAAISALTLPLARELSSSGVRVVSIAPGPFETPMLRNAPIVSPPSLFPHRYGQPSEFSDLVSHIISNSMINGTTIRLDGALRATI